MTAKETWLKQIARVSGDTEFQRDVAQVKSKALLKEISPSPPQVKWTYVESKILRTASALTFIVENIALSDPDDIEKIGQSALRLASLWENLSKLGEKTDEKKALMNAAVAYEIAGYQANALCLARKIEHKLLFESTPTIEELASIFLQRFYLKLRNKCSGLLKEPNEFNDHGKVISSIGLALSAQGFMEATTYFLNGSNSSLENANTSFLGSEKVFAESGFIKESNLVHSIRSLIPIMKKRSSWENLENISGDPRWERYLKLLARGTGKRIFESSSVSELWPSQINALTNGLLNSTANKIIKMPTSAGKTRIAELAMVHTLIKSQNAKCVYVAPYKALVSELQQSFLELFSDLGYKVSSIIGTFEKDLLEEELLLDADILVVTPEKLDLLLRIKPEFLNDVHLFILDEGHVINNGKRGIKFELLLTRLKRKLPQTRFLFLSAVFSEQTLKEFARWFGSGEDSLIESKWRPSIQRYARFSWTSKNEGIMNYTPSDDNMLIQTFIPKIIVPKEYTIKNFKTKKRSRIIFPKPEVKSQTAAELAFQFSELGPVLVFCAAKNWVEDVASSLQLRLKYMREVEERIPDYFKIFESSRSIMVAREWLGENHPITLLLKQGIAIHHGNLPESLRKSIETDFRERKFRVLIATNTLAQGVNLPIRTVIIHSCRRFVNNRIELIPITDYWNIAGRAGRAGQETEGTVIHIAPKKQDQEDYEYYMKHKDILEPTKSALFKLLLDLVNERITDKEAMEELDSEILAILAEETKTVENIEEIINESLVGEQTKTLDLPTTDLKRLFKITAKQIGDNISDRKYWKIYSATGLSATSCETIRNYIVSYKEEIFSLVKNGNSSDVMPLLSKILSILDEIPEMKEKTIYDGDYIELLEGWLSGKNVHEIAQEIEYEDTIKIANFIENYFGYLLPWGISAFIQIAMFEFGLSANELSDYINFLPSMVKYGVPTPESSWAVSSGVPFRKTAIEMAARYVSENNTVDRNEFLEWISKIDPYNLQINYNLQSPILEDVTEALGRSGINPLLKSNQTLQQVISTRIWISGIGFDNRWVTASRARVGQNVKLERDYYNMYDRNATKVFLNSEELGFLDRNTAQFLAPHLDCGLNLLGEIAKIEKEGKIPQIQLQLQIP